MRLISLHVENFGKLQGLDERFDEGLNVRLQDNGAGKSTLAVFIKSMLYGMPVTTKRSLIENERKRYTPWQGGAYGGSLDIEVDGKEYRIERLFGAKQAEDMLRVTDLQTGREAEVDWAASPGERLFGVDIAAYERSVYISQRPAELSEQGMDSIHTKLNRLVDATDDLCNYDATMAALERRRQYYRHLRGEGGAIADAEAELRALDRELERIEAAGAAAEQARVRLDEIKREMDALDKDMALISQKEAQLHRSREARAVQARLAALALEQDELKAQIDALSASLGGKAPTEQEIEQLERALAECDEARLRMAASGMDEQEASELAKLREQLSVPYPTEQQMDALRRAADEYHRAALAADPLFDTHADGNGAAEAVLAERQSALERQQQRYGQMLAQREQIIARLTRKGGYTLPIVLIALSAALLLAGIVWPVLLVAGGTLAVLSLTVLSVYNARRAGQRRDDEARLVGINHDLSHIENELNGAKASLRAAETGVHFASLWRAVTTAASCPSGMDAPLQVDRLVGRYERLHSLAAKERAGASDEAWRSAKERLERLLSDFPGAPADCGRVIGWLSEARALLADRTAGYERKAREIAALREQYGTESAEFRAALSAADGEQPDEHALAQQKQRLQAEHRVLGEQLLRTEQQLRSLAATVDERDAYESERARKAAVIEEQKEHLDAILQAEKYLKLARENLSGRYLTTMKERFAHYMSLVSGSAAPVFTMDAQFRVKIREGGAGRSTEAFSVGVRELISICERLSLLDAMFEGERPLLVLDDPFTNLDQATLRRANALLGRVAERYQVLYLTCHPSRVPNKTVFEEDI